MFEGEQADDRSVAPDLMARATHAGLHLEPGRVAAIQTVLDDVMAEANALKTLDLSDAEPAIVFDPSWPPEESP